MNKVTLKQQLEAFEKGDFLELSGELNTGCFVFYDWFCRDSSLERKAIQLFKKTKRFIKAKNIDVDNTYVFFKNNCPVEGSLYDDFRICDLETGKVIFTVTPKSSHSGEAELWGVENKFNGPIQTASNFRELLKKLDVT